MEQQKNTLKPRLNAGEAVFGAWIGMGSATVAELMGGLGFDFLIVDLEHGQGDLSLGLDMIRAVQSSGTACVVRVPSSDPIFLKRILDAGADGIMVPSVETGEEAARVVSACRYPPNGFRGYAAPNVRASRYGIERDYTRRAAENLLIVVQIESATAVDEAAKICAVEGVDVVFIGVNDLGGSIGRLEQLEDAGVRDLVTRVEAEMRSAGKIMGTVPSAGASWQELLDAGYTFLPIAADVSLMRDAGLAVVGEVRSRAHRPE